MSLCDLFSSPKRKPYVAVVGDVILDVYRHCTAKCLSPEDELTPVVTELKQEFKAGGASNVALNLQSLGAKVDLYGAVGDDHDGKVLQALLSRVDLGDRLFIDTDRKTTRKERIVLPRNRHSVRIDNEDKHAVDISFAATLLDLIEEQRAYDLVVVSDYAKGVITEPFMWELEAMKVPYVVDPKGTDFLKYGAAVCIKPNLHELQQVIRRHTNDVFGDEEDPLDLLAHICPMKAKSLLVTRGPDGAVLFDAPDPDSDESQFNILEIEAQRRVFGDPSGCGDSALAALAYGLGCKWSLDDASKLAVAAGSCAFDHVGVHVVTRDELKKELQNGQPKA
jgi:D-beta-D-heptose 7-phosphate kinase/D-beta-D-heptose 1-phosphate adenosyltransferase